MKTTIFYRVEQRKSVIGISSSHTLRQVTYTTTSLELTSLVAEPCLATKPTWQLKYKQVNKQSRSQGTISGQYMDPKSVWKHWTSRPCL